MVGSVAVMWVRSRFVTVVVEGFRRKRLSFGDFGTPPGGGLRNGGHHQIGPWIFTPSVERYHGEQGFARDGLAHEFRHV